MYWDDKKLPPELARRQAIFRLVVVTLIFITLGYWGSAIFGMI